MGQPSSGARGYSWPPFESGNVVAVRHGAHSPRLVEARAAVVREELFAICPWLDEAQDVVAVARFLRAEARSLMLHQHIEAVASERGVGAVPVKLWEQATTADRLAAQLGNVLGLDPSGRARLQQTVARTELTLADLVNAGQAALDARNANGITTEADP